MDLWFRALESLVLVVSLTTDAFAAGVVYGAQRLRVPWSSAVVISLVCSATLGVSMLGGRVAGGWLPADQGRWLSFWLLLGMGLARLFDNALKSYIRKHRLVRLGFSANQLRFLLMIYADAPNADRDASRSLSAPEAAVLALALSLDGLGVGLGSALAGTGVCLSTVLCLLLTLAAVKGGCRLGERLPGLLPFDLSWFSAGLLIALALTRLT